MNGENNSIEYTNVTPLTDLEKVKLYFIHYTMDMCLDENTQKFLSREPILDADTSIKLVDHKHGMYYLEVVKYNNNYYKLTLYDETGNTDPNNFIDVEQINLDATITDTNGIITISTPDGENYTQGNGYKRYL